jgi:hypothetical protein
VLCFIALVVVFLSLFWIPGTLHYEITETYSISVDTTSMLHLVISLPTSGPYQQVSDPEIIWPGRWNLDLSGRLNVLEMEGELQSGETIEAIITYTVNLSQGEARWFGQPVEPEDQSSTEEIQADHPDIVTQAQDLVEDDDRLTTAKRIFDFTIHHLNWPNEKRLNPDVSALHAYQSEIGGSTEHVNLMTALCRAIDIPSRPVSGMVLPDSIPFFTMSTTRGHPARAQAWLELFVNNAWILADPSRSNAFFQHDLFAWTDGRHLVYDTIVHEAEVYDLFVSKAEESGGTLIASMSAPLRFVAWSEKALENASLTPDVRLRKTWDARYVWMVSIILILIIINWVIRVK